MNGAGRFARLAAVGGASLAAVGTIAGIVFAWTSHRSEAAKSLQTSELERARTEVASILASRVPPPAADKLGVYVPRLELENELKSFVRKLSTAGGMYMVVVGARGAGKSTLVEHVLSEMDGGVLIVPLGEASSTTSDLDALIVQAALKKYKLPTDSPHATSEPIKGGYLAERLEAVAKARGEPGWRPTIVLDMNLSGDGPLIRAACARLKVLAHDKALCHAILLLSSSFAVAELPRDPDRQQFVRVGALSDGEARAQLESNFKALLPEHVATAAAVAAVKERVLPLTTRPSRLSAVVEAVLGSKDEEEFAARAEAWASGFEAAARKEVAASLNPVLSIFIRDDEGDFKDRACRTRDLMRALLDAGRPIELPSAGYNVPAELFASKIRESNAAKATFDVDLVANTVDFASSAHRKAAAKLLSPSPSGLLAWLFASGGPAVEFK
ncbi:hypothetical protein KFE25_010453 [Diacronema lutheri]|uniref:Uncharacterized protein n=1 Tax=Diacronema lutheri TaxID=2081491 RepID=A0A8J6BZD3_DIALT|nr:hypothetical protein KFE25_010453 [Diacronema lutheri]